MEVSKETEVFEDEELINLNKRKTLAWINFMFAGIALIFLGLFIADNTLFANLAKTPVPVECVTKGFCEFNITMANPSGRNIVYLKYGKIYQNFKDYSASFSSKVFKDNINPSTTVVKSCKPMHTNAAMNKTEDYTGVKLEPNHTALPCGAIAYTYPGVEVSLHKGNETLLLNEAKTIDGKFNYILRKKQTKKAWLKLEDNYGFANWLNLAPVPYFIKPVAVVDIKHTEKDEPVRMRMLVGNLEVVEKYVDILQVHVRKLGIFGQPSRIFLASIGLFAIICLYLGCRFAYKPKLKEL